MLSTVFMIAILPAVGEELVFRGLIQRHLNEWFRNGHLAVLVTSVIFSLVHFQVYSFLPRFFLGLLLGYMMLYGRSVWYPIIAHFINNAIGVVFYYLYFRDQAGTAIEDIGTQDMMPITALFSFLLVAGMMVFWIVTERISRTARTS